MTSFCMSIYEYYMYYSSRTLLKECIILVVVVVQYWQRYYVLQDLHNSLSRSFYNTVSAGRFCLS
jgi:hypothetical protein